MARVARRQLPSKAGQLPGDWGLLFNFLNGIKRGDLTRIVFKSVQKLANEIRFELVNALMTHGASTGVSFTPISGWQYERRKRMSHATLSGSTGNVDGTFEAPPPHWGALWFTGAYASSIIEQSKIPKTGKSGVIRIQPDPTAVLKYHSDRGLVSSIAVSQLAGMLESGWFQDDGRPVPPRPHWVPTFFKIPKMKAYNDLENMDEIRQEIYRKYYINLGVI
jgi:hypothetical protein